MKGVMQDSGMPLAAGRLVREMVEGHRVDGSSV